MRITEILSLVCNHVEIILKKTEINSKQNRLLKLCSIVKYASSIPQK